MGNPYVAPHHRVDAKVHRAARAKALKAGVSLSAVADAGLRAFTSNATATTKAKARAALANGQHAARTPTLPDETGELLREMVRSKDPRLTPYLGALRDAGWSFANLAAPLGVSRQAVHLRLTGWDGKPSKKALPYVPPGRGNTSFPAHPPASAARFDWSVWADRELYAIATEHAAAQKVKMREVMEQVLRDYVSGGLVLDKKALARKYPSGKEDSR